MALIERVSGLTTKCPAGGVITHLVSVNTQETFWTAEYMVMVIWSGITAKLTKVSFKTVTCMEEVRWHMPMGQSTKVTGKKVKNTARVSWNIRMALYMKASGKKINDRGRVGFFYLTGWLGDWNSERAFYWKNTKLYNLPKICRRPKQKGK